MDGYCVSNIASSEIELLPQCLTMFDILCILERTEVATVDSNYPTWALQALQTLLKRCLLCTDPIVISATSSTHWKVPTNPLLMYNPGDDPVLGASDYRLHLHTFDDH